MKGFAGLDQLHRKTRNSPSLLKTLSVSTFAGHCNRHATSSRIPRVPQLAWE
jgi:hypothetical protein